LESIANLSSRCVEWGINLKLDTNSIKFRLWLYFTLFIMFTMAVIWLLQTVFLAPYYEYMRTLDVKTATSEIIKAYGNENFKTIAEEISFKENIGINIFDAQGNSIYVANTFGIRGPFAPPPNNDIWEDGPTNGSISSGSAVENDNRFPVNQSAVATRFFGTQLFERGISALNEQKDKVVLLKVDNPKVNSSMLFYITPINDYFLFVSTEIKPIEATVSILQSQLGLITIIVVVLAALLSILIAVSISKPLSRITLASRMLAAKKFPDDCQGGSYSETRELAETLRKTASELNEAENLKREFIGNISHDLRTPMTMIKAYAEALRDLPYDDPERKKNDLSVIIRESDRMTELIQDLLELSKLEAGDTTLKIEDFSMTQLVTDTLLSYNIYSERDGYSLDFDFENEVICTADRKKMAQVLHNLIFNAISHAGSDKHVAIRQLKLPVKIRIEVQNKGEEIPSEQLPYIWDRYFKFDRNIAKESKSSGLGLAIVKSALELHKADYGVQSSAENGTTFWFEIPC
jgi:signal transduction histidine kinase